MRRCSLPQTRLQHSLRVNLVVVVTVRLQATFAGLREQVERVE